MSDVTVRRRLLLTGLIQLLLLGGTGRAAPLAAQTSTRPARSEALHFPADVSFILRIDANALAWSQIVPRLLERPEASNPLARALGRPSTLAKIHTVYVGFPAGFTPASTELPVLIIGSFGNEQMLAELATARGVVRTPEAGRMLLEATGPMGTSYATGLGEGTLALGDHASVLRMIEVWEGKRQGIGAALSSAIGPGGAGGDAEPSRDVFGAGRVPVALRGYLHARGGSLAAPFAAIDRVTFEGSLGRALDLRASLQPTTSEARLAIEQALGALRMFGPSRFANDPELLSTIQSLRFTVGPEWVDLTVTVPRSLLLQLF